MKEIVSIAEMLRYFGYKTLADFGKAYGLYTMVDAKRMLYMMYEDKED